jgi:hypothetical protein
VRRHGVRAFGYGFDGRCGLRIGTGYGCHNASLSRLDFTVFAIIDLLICRPPCASLHWLIERASQI